MSYSSGNLQQSFAGAFNTLKKKQRESLSAFNQKFGGRFKDVFGQSPGGGDGSLALQSLNSLPIDDASLSSSLSPAADNEFMSSSGQNTMFSANLDADQKSQHSTGTSGTQGVNTPLTPQINDIQQLSFNQGSSDFLIKVFVPDVDTKFTLKVNPQMNVDKLVAMVKQYLKTRGLAVETEDDDDDLLSPWSASIFSAYVSSKSLTGANRSSAYGSNVVSPQSGGNSMRKGAKYGLYMPSRKTWMAQEDGKTLEFYSLAANPEELQYKIRFLPLTIKVPEHLSQKIEAAQSGVERIDPIEQPAMTQILVTEGQTVAEGLELLNFSNQVAAEYGCLLQVPPTEVFALYTRAGEKLKASDLLWTIAMDMSPVDCLEYRMQPRKLQITSTEDVGVKVEVEVDLSKKLCHVLPLMWRRFGIDQSMTFRGIRLISSKNDLDLNENLMEQNVRPGSALLLDLEISTSPKQSQSELGKNQTDLVNIWEEGADSESNINFSTAGDGVIVAGTVNKLVEALTSAGSSESADSNAYMDFLKTFLLTYQSFTTPLIFLKKMVERYHVPRQKQLYPQFSDYEKMRLRIQLRVCNVMQQWTKKFFYDFVDHTASTQDCQSEDDEPSAVSLMKHQLLMEALDFVENVVLEDHPSLARQIRKNMMRLRDGSWINSQAKAQFNDPPPAVKFSSQQNKVANGKVVNLFNCDPEEIARQLTLIEFQLFDNVMPYEFLNQSWTKEDASIRAPGIMKITKRFNEVAFWVAKSVLEVKSLNERVKRMSRLIEIAYYLYKMSNFSTLMAFVAGFNKAPITRLKHTIKELPMKYGKKMADLETLMTAESSYKLYRQKLHTVNPPCIPYLGVYLLDLTYMEDGNPNKIGSLVNFAKRRLIYGLIREVQQYQDKPFNFMVVPEIRGKIHELSQMPLDDNGIQLTMKAAEDQLFQQSLEIEPRNADRSSLLVQ
ncbi:hypothetical protein MP228_004705 [Amoeboaphelidium protococcarum]|nr:hypothetical protein MP228_004705 [Amoeboaphelidium protococcarum]